MTSEELLASHVDALREGQRDIKKHVEEARDTQQILLHLVQDTGKEVTRLAERVQTQNHRLDKLEDEQLRMLTRQQVKIETDAETQKSLRWFIGLLFAGAALVGPFVLFGLQEVVKK